jgi:hypothetical protein
MESFCEKACEIVNKPNKIAERKYHLFWTKKKKGTLLVD